MVRPVRRRARHPGGLVALRLPRPGHPGRRHVQIGFVADASIATDPDATDITSYGGWRSYLASESAAGH